MTADDLNAPLGQGAKKKPRFVLPITAPQVVAAGLGAIVLTFALWVVLVDNPMGRRADGNGRARGAGRRGKEAG